MVYKGGDDDAALNKGVLRYAADPEGVRRFAEDTNLTGRIGVPVIALHAIGDPTAFVELESALKRSMEAGGASQWLVQGFTNHREHSYLADAMYPAALAALLEWVDAGKKPSAASLAERCAAMEATYGPGCQFATAYQPAPLAARIAPRPGI